MFGEVGYGDFVKKKGFLGGALVVNSENLCSSDLFRTFKNCPLEIFIVEILLVLKGFVGILILMVLGFCFFGFFGVGGVVLGLCDGG